MKELFRTLIVETVGLCNLRCSICPTNYYGKAFKKIMPEEIFRRLLPYFYPGLTVILTGWGEPLLDKDLEKRIASAKGLS